jgi:hypothetical protein
MTKSQLGLLGSVLAAGALAIAGCGGGGGGGGTGGKADGGTGGKATGGTTGTGGKVDAGTDAGSDVRTDSGAGGTTTVVDGGDARTDAGDVPAGDGGTDAATQTLLYDFESGVQGWASSGATVTASTDQHFDGVQSLKIAFAPAPEAGTAPNNVLIPVDNHALWPGTMVTLHAFFPTGTPTTGSIYFQAFSQYNAFGGFDSAGNSTHTIMPGAFNTWTYTIPNTFPGGLNRLGVQVGDNANGTIIAGTNVYLDAITATGGVQNCAVGTGTGSHDFEPGDAGAFNLDPQIYGVDSFPAGGTVALSTSTDQAFTGANSWKLAFTGLPTGTYRQIFIANPNIYCGQTFTIHVFMPTGSDGVTFKAYVQYNYFSKTGAMGPATTTRNGWNTVAYTVPADVGPGGIQRIGIQVFNDRTAPDGGAADGGDGGAADGGDGGAADGGDGGAAPPTDFSGNIYIDSVTW